MRLFVSNSAAFRALPSTLLGIRNRTRRVALLTAFFVSGFAHQVYADVSVTSDFVFQLSNSFFNSPEFSFSSQLQGEQQFTLPDTVIAGPAPVTVSGISGSVSYQLSPSTTQITLGSEIGLRSSQFVVNLNIQSVSVNTVIQTVVGSTTIVSPIQASCTNIPVQLSNGAGQLVGSILPGVDASGLPTITVPSFVAQWAPGAWTIGNFACTGVSGFQTQVIQGIQNYLSNSSMFNSQLQALLSAKTASYQTQVRALFLQPRVLAANLAGISVTMTPLRLQNALAGGFQLVGTLGFIFQSTQKSQAFVVTATEAAPQTLSGYALLIPAAAWNTLNAAAFMTGLYQYEQPGNQIAAFESLLSSWFEEFFVWPQLMSYRSSSSFLFHYVAANQPGLSDFTDNGDGTLSQAFIGTLNAVTLAPTSTGGNLPMLTFQAPIQGAARVSFAADASGNTTLNASFSDLSMQPGTQLSGIWDRKYVRSNHPNQYVNYSLIQSNAISGLLNQGFSIAVGRLPLTESLSLTPTSLQTHSSWLQVNWQ